MGDFLRENFFNFLDKKWQNLFFFSRKKLHGHKNLIEDYLEQFYSLRKSLFETLLVYSYAKDIGMREGGIPKKLRTENLKIFCIITTVNF